MSMETNLVGRLHNTSLPISHGLMPLFEAVANSIHAIEEASIPIPEARISVEIVRDPQAVLNLEHDSRKRGPEAKGDIVGFKIVDNGIGFNEANVQSFKTLDSDYKASKGGRGVGRLLWLKAFQRVNVNSVFVGSDNKAMKRTFRFGTPSGVQDDDVSDSVAEERVTCVHLDGFKDKYRDASPKTAGPIADSLFEHCLWYFVRSGGAPKIRVIDGEVVVDLDAVYEAHMVSSAEVEEVQIKGIDFELTHIRLRANSARQHMAAYCAANRVVQEESLRGRIPGLFGALSDEKGDFSYQCFVCSPFLDENVRSERTGFDLDEKPMDMFADTDIGLEDIRSLVIERAANHLSGYLDANKQRGKQRVDNFVSHKAPRYRPILARISDNALSIDPDISDKDLDLVLHKHLTEFERQIIVDGHELMKPESDERTDEYSGRLQEYLALVEDIKKSDLANYVSHRKVVIDLVQKAIERGADGKYAREDRIHQLIMPMRVDSNDVASINANLWLIDERLAFHDYLASDKSLSSMPITGSGEAKEPDLCCLQIFDNPILVTEKSQSPFASLTVVEIKRPMRNDAREGEEKDPIEQALGYLKRIRDGKVTTAKGRPIGNASSIPGYCYVICDLTSSVKDRCDMHDLIQTSDGLGYFGYKKAYQAFIEVVSFDQLVNAAKERNRAFFDKLGLPTS
jgi:hypothetical protein